MSSKLQTGHLVAHIQCDTMLQLIYEYLSSQLPKFNGGYLLASFEVAVYLYKIIYPRGAAISNVVAVTRVINFMNNCTYKHLV